VWKVRGSPIASRLGAVDRDPLSAIEPCCELNCGISPEPAYPRPHTRARDAGATVAASPQAVAGMTDIRNPDQFFGFAFPAMQA